MTDTIDSAKASPHADQLALLTTPLAGPWPRYWARLFDITWVGFTVCLLIFWAVPVVLGAAFAIDPAYDKLITLAALPVVFVLDAVVQRIFGNTPGKFIAGIRVETTQMKRPTLSQLIKRNLIVWVKGIALGIPLVSIASLMACYLTVRNGRLTSWDANNDTRVVARNSNVYRTLLTFVALLTLSLGLAALDYFGSIMEKSQAAAELAKANAQLPMQIDDQTRMDRIEDADGLLTYTYTLVDRRGAPSMTPMQMRELRSPKFKAFMAQYYCAPYPSGPRKPVSPKASYRYRDLDGSVVAEFTLTPEDCTSAAP